MDLSGIPPKATSFILRELSETAGHLVDDRFRDLVADGNVQEAVVRLEKLRADTPDSTTAGQLPPEDRSFINGLLAGHAITFVEEIVIINT